LTFLHLEDLYSELGSMSHQVEERQRSLMTSWQIEQALRPWKDHRLSQEIEDFGGSLAGLQE